MIYGYDAKLSSRGIHTIKDYGRGQLEELRKMRSTPETRRRPVFFIAHSFGGLIVAHCLIEAAQAYERKDDAFVDLHAATYGILFFGTPHRGMVVEDIKKMIVGEKNHPRDALLDQIAKESESLIARLSDFKNVLGDRKVVSFFEQKQTRAPAKNGDSQTWTRSGSYATAVTVDSASLDLPDALEIKILLNADHSNMVKFNSKHDEGHSSALRCLKDFEREAPGVVAARFARKSSAPVPSSNVPFRRHEGFVGREDSLAAIMGIIERSGRHNRAAIYGLGGVGKSQIAIEFSYRFRAQNPGVWVFWVYASDAVSFTESFRNIASRVELPGREDPKSDLLRLVFNWLSDERNGKWLIILDNADDASIFFRTRDQDEKSALSLSSGTGPLAKYLPQTPNGSVALTSRYKKMASTLVLGDDTIIEVKKLDESTAMDLLRTHFKVTTDNEADCHELVRALELLPLAIVQAASYIKAMGGSISVLQYLNLVEADQQATKILEKTYNDPRRHESLPVSVMSTWKISFEQIRQQAVTAAVLFSRMSVMNRQAIPSSFFRNEEHLDLEFEEALVVLLDFSLVTADADRKQSSMHRMVQLASKNWLDTANELRHAQEWCLTRMEQQFPEGSYENIAKCEELVAHIKPILNGIECDSRELRLLMYTIYHNCASYYNCQGNYDVAEAMGQLALEGREKELGATHALTLASVHNLALMLDHQGKYEIAEVMNRRVLERREKEPGPLHPKTLTSVSNLASVLRGQQRYKDSEAMNRRALEGCRKTHGPTHHSTLTSVNNLAGVLQDQGKYKESEKMYRQSLHGFNEELGRDHPLTLTNLSNLALVLQKQRRYGESEDMQQRCLEHTERIHGPIHPSTLATIENLASVSQAQGKLEVCETLIWRALTARKDTLGIAHPSTLTTLSHLALLFLEQNKVGQSAEISRLVLKVREMKLGLANLDTLRSINNVASILRIEGKYDESETMLRQALAGFCEVLGGGHPESVRIRINLILLLREQGKTKAADDLEQENFLSENEELDLASSKDPFETSEESSWRINGPVPQCHYRQVEFRPPNAGCFGVDNIRERRTGRYIC